MTANTERLTNYKNDAGQSFDENVPLWRYMDLPKFEKLISSKTLWFSRANKLGDGFEGSVSQGTALRSPAYFANSSGGSGRSALLITFISCWHYSETENSLMWSAYAKEGVAVRTSFNKLVEALPKEVTVAPVSYFDYERDYVPPYHPDRFHSKRKEFTAEQEVRAVYVDQKPIQETDENRPEFGRVFNLDLDRMFEAVVCRPFAHDNDVVMIRKLLRTSGVDISVKRSSLSGKVTHL